MCQVYFLPEQMWNAAQFPKLTFRVVHQEEECYSSLIPLPTNRTPTLVPVHESGGVEQVRSRVRVIQQRASLVSTEFARLCRYRAVYH